MTDRIAEIQERLEKATPGPWESRGPMGYDFEYEVRTEDAEPRNKHYWPMRICQTIRGQRSDADAANFDFIAHAPTDIKTLLRLLEEAERRRDEAEGLVQMLMTNDPMEYVADGGVTVLDVWRKEVERVLRRGVR